MRENWRMVSWLTPKGNFGRKRVALISIRRAQVGIFVALGTNGERDSSHGRRVRGDGAERVVIGEGQAIGCRRHEWTSKLLVRRSGSHLAAEPPAPILLVFIVLNSAEAPKRGTHLYIGCIGPGGHCELHDHVRWP